MCGGKVSTNFLSSAAIGGTQTCFKFTDGFLSCHPALEVFLVK